ncbi:hypothetical protein M422DRAFT_261847 [Sphaerobolus stellatus SS14]|uniref:Uncharacterized protein n=1 Tax=Sphaerobolus stellatus (strain SS14) TaxID=990650 RepID=A0A0C9VER2_SPHS4|nr:hypothetical protein M422DRAFT_261847 [Sphaerobolus stellatus SS14]
MHLCLKSEFQTQPQRVSLFASRCCPPNADAILAHLDIQRPAETLPPNVATQQLVGKDCRPSRPQLYETQSEISAPRLSVVIDSISLTRERRRATSGPRNPSLWHMKRPRSSPKCLSSAEPARAYVVNRRTALRADERPKYELGADLTRACDGAGYAEERADALGLKLVDATHERQVEERERELTRLQTGHGVGATGGIDVEVRRCVYVHGLSSGRRKYSRKR